MNQLKSTLEEKQVVLKAMEMMIDYFEDKLRYGELDTYKEIMEYDIAKKCIAKLKHNIVQIQKEKV